MKEEASVSAITQVVKIIRSHKLTEKGKNCMTKKQVYICV